MYANKAKILYSKCPRQLHKTNPGLKMLHYSPFNMKKHSQLVISLLSLLQFNSSFVKGSCYVSLLLMVTQL